MITGLIGWLAGSRWALAAAKWGAVGLTLLLFLLSVRRAGERAGRMAQRLETMARANEVQRRMLDAAARRPRDRDELWDHLTRPKSASAADLSRATAYRGGDPRLRDIGTPAAALPTKTACE